MLFGHDNWGLSSAFPAKFEPVEISPTIFCFTGNFDELFGSKIAIVLALSLFSK